MALYQRRLTEVSFGDDMRQRRQQKYVFARLNAQRRVHDG